jgi:hypothetical protein
MQSRRLIKWLVFFLVGAVYVAAYSWSLATFRGETSLDPVSFGAAGEKEADCLVLHLSVMEVDPITQEMSLRLVPEPRGNLLAPGAQVLASDLFLDMQGARAAFGSTLAEGRSDIVFTRDRFMTPVDVTIMLEGGSVDRYPFDSYRVDFMAQLSRPDSMTATGFRGVPLVIKANLGVAGYELSVKETPRAGVKGGRDGLTQTTTDTVAMAISVRRSQTAFGFAIFLMAIVGSLALACASVAVWVVVLGRKVEPQFFTWMAGTLFAIVGLRGVLPGHPPLGALPDFLVFIWAESLVTLSLLCIVTAYLRRHPGKQ